MAMTSCWYWAGSIQSTGYGRIKVSGKEFRAHRFVYEALVGEIPKGLVIDHLCENKICVNPEHLEPVTSKENTLRCATSPATLNKVKTHCPLKHEYNPSNTYHYADGRRMCRTCDRNKSKLRQRLYRSLT